MTRPSTSRVGGHGGGAEELTDVVEVLRALAAEARLSLDDVISLAGSKRAARVGFELGLFLVRVEDGLPDG